MVALATDEWICVLHYICIRLTLSRDSEPWRIDYFVSLTAHGTESVDRYTVICTPKWPVNVIILNVTDVRRIRMYVYCTQLADIRSSIEMLGGAFSIDRSMLTSMGFIFLLPFYLLTHHGVREKWHKNGENEAHSLRIYRIVICNDMRTSLPIVFAITVMAFFEWFNFSDDCIIPIICHSYFLAHKTIYISINSYGVFLVGYKQFWQRPLTHHHAHQ